MRKDERRDRRSGRKHREHPAHQDPPEAVEPPPKPIERSLYSIVAASRRNTVDAKRWLSGM